VTKDFVVVGANRFLARTPMISDVNKMDKIHF